MFLLLQLHLKLLNPRIILIILSIIILLLNILIVNLLIIYLFLCIFILLYLFILPCFHLHSTQETQFSSHFFQLVSFTPILLLLHYLPSFNLLPHTIHRIHRLGMFILLQELIKREDSFHFLSCFS